MKDNFYLKAGVILDRTGGDGDGKGDCIFRTAHFAMIKNDYTMLETCCRLLYNRRRWPQELDDPSGKEHRKIEGFGSMTRDPYIMFYSACVMMNRRQLIEVTRIPWYTNRPSIRWWRKYLIDPSTRARRKYIWWERFENLFFKLPAFALYLNCWMAYAAKSETVMEMYRPQIPHWNYMLYELTLHPLKHLNTGFILAYLPRTGFIWQSDHWQNELDYLYASDEYQMDRGILLYVYERNNEQH